VLPFIEMEKALGEASLGRLNLIHLFIQVDYGIVSWLFESREAQ
jgi:hypothetical protein